MPVDEIVVNTQDPPPSLSDAPQDVVETVYEPEQKVVQIFPDGYVAKDVEFYNSRVPAYNARNKANLPLSDDPSDDDYLAVDRDFKNHRVEIYNSVNKKFGLGLPEVQSANEITPDNERKIDEVQVASVLNNANKELKLAQAIFPELKSFKPFKDIADIQARGTEYETKIKQATSASTKSEQQKLVSSLNAYVEDFNKQTGSKLPAFKDYASAKKAITPNKDGETPFGKQLDIYQSEHPIVEPITLQPAKPIVDKLGRAENEEMRKKADFVYHISENERAAKAAALKENALRLQKTTLKSKGHSVPLLEPFDIQYLSSVKGDEKYHQDAAEITAKRTIEFQNKANELMPEFKSLQQSINQKTQEGLIVPQAEIDRYNVVKEDIKNLLDAADVMDNTAKKKYAELFKIKAEQGNFLSGGGRVGLSTLGDLSKSASNLFLSALSYDPIANQLGFGREEANKLIGDVDKSIDFVEQEMSDKLGLASKEYVESQGGLRKAAYDVIGILPYVAASELKVPGLTLAMMTTQGYAAEKRQLNSDPKFNSLTPEQKDVVALTKGLVGAIVMEMGLKLGKSGTMINNLTYDAIKSGAARMGFNSANSYLRRKAVEYTSGVVSQGVSFGALNFAGTFANHGTNEIINAIKGEDLFEMPSAGQMLTEAWQSAEEGILTGALLGAGTGIVNAVKKGKMDFDEFKVINEMFDNPAAFDLYAANIRQQVIDKKITKPEASEHLKALTQYRDVASQIPKDMPLRPRFEVTTLMLENKSLEAQKAGLNPLFTKTIDKRIAENEKAIVEIADNEESEKLPPNETQDAKVTDTKGTATNRQTDLLEKKDTVNGDTITPKTNAEVSSKEVTPTISESGKPTTETAPTNDALKDIKAKSDSDIEKRMAEIEGDKTYSNEFNSLEKEMEKRERDSVFNVSLDKVNNAIDILIQKEKEMPNGFGSFIDKQDAKETKAVAKKYLNAKSLSDEQIKIDFKNALRGNPTTWYADGLQLRESMKEASNRGIVIDDLLNDVAKEYTKDGFDIETAKSVIAGMLKPIYEGSEKVNESALATNTVEGEAKSITEKGKSIADKIRELKSPKGTMQADLTFGLKDAALEAIALLVEGGAKVIDAISQVMKDDKYKSLDKDEIKKMVLDANPLTEKDFKRGENEKMDERNKRLAADLEERGYEDSEIDYIVKGGIERLEKVNTDREEAKVVGNLNKILKATQAKYKDMPLEKAIDTAIERVQGEWQEGKDAILENAIRKFKKEHGIEVITPVDRAVKPKSVKISVDEKKALTDQIKLEVKAAKEGAKSVTDGFKSVSKVVSDILKEHKTTISTKQLNAIQKRMAMLKVGSNESVRKYVDYVEKVLADAEYADQLTEVKSTSKKIKKLIKNDKIPAAVRRAANEFISLDAADVRNLNKHQAIMNELYDAMKSGGIKMSDGQIVDKTRKAADLDKINEYVAEEMELAAKRLQESMAEEYDETVENLASEEPSDASDRIKEYVKNKFAGLSRMVQDMVINGKSPLDGEVYDFSKEDLSLIKKSAAMNLDQFENVKDWYEATEALDHLLTNGDVGLIPHIVNKYENAVIVNKGLETLKTKLGGKIAELPITRAFAGLEALFKSRAKDSHAEKVFFENTSFRRWDNLLKNWKDYGIYEGTFYHLAQGQSNYKTLVRQMDADRIQKELFKGNGYDQKKNLLSKYKITAFLRQLEYESNPESKSNRPAIDYLNATVEAAEYKEHPIQGKALELLKDVIAEYSTDGQIDLKKLEKGLTPQEKAAIAGLQKLYKDLAPYHTKVSLAIRNKLFTAIDNYSHISAYSKDNKILSPSETKRQYMNVLQGTKSGTIEERSGAASAINMDPFASANKAVRDVMLDYWMTNPFKNVEKILTKFKDYAVDEKKKFPRGTPEYENAVKRENIADAWLGIFNDARENMLMRSYYESTPLKKFTQLVQKRAVQYTLARPARLLAELTSNTSFVMSSATKEFLLGTTKYREYNGHDQAKIMANLSSSATERLHPHGGMATSVMDTQDFDISVSDNQNLVSPAKRKALQVYYYTIARAIGKGEAASEWAITKGDLAIARPIWTGTMATEFKKLTGKEIDFDKIMENDLEYIDENESALDKARTIADRKVTDAAASKNPFETSSKMSTRSTQVWQAINKYMRGFNMNEYELASDAVMHLYNGGKMSQADAIRILGGITARAGMYKVVQTLASTAIMGGLMAGWAAMSDDDKTYSELEKEIGADKPDTPENRRKMAEKLLEKFGKEGDPLQTGDEETIKFWKSQAEEPNSFSEDFIQGVAQQYLSMFTQRNFGNIVQGYVTAPIFEQMINKKIREGMGLGYNPYKDGLLYSKLPDTDKRNWMVNSIEQGTGAYGTPIAMFMESALAGVNIRKDMAKLDEVNKEIEAHKEGKPVENSSLKDYYKLVEQKKTIEGRIMDNWAKIGKETTIAIGMLFGAIPGLKDIDKAWDKMLQDKYRKPKDFKELMENYELLKKGYHIQKEKEEKEVSEYYRATQAGHKIPPKD